MMLNDKEKIRQFLKLVKSGASLKSYRTVGLDRAGLNYHLQYIAEYERILSDPEPKTESVKVEAPKPKKIRSVRKAKLKPKKDKNEDTEGLQRDVRLRDTEESTED